MEWSTIRLPHGYARGNDWVATVSVRQLTGHDQRYLTENNASGSSTARTMGLLARLVNSAESSRAIDEISMLTAGDREAVLLHLCRSLAGDRVAALTNCPECGECITLELVISHMLVSPAARPARTYEASVEGHHMHLRPINGADLARAATACEKATEWIARACVMSSEPPLPQGPLSPELIDALSNALGELDPQADILLDIRCSVCGQMGQLPFDAGDFLLQIIDPRRKWLDEEIHALAFYYHWTEETILALPIQRRRRYVDLIANELSGENR